MTIQNSINANSVTPLSVLDGGTGLSNPTNHGILISEGTSAFNPIVLSAGQVLIGTTGADPAAATLTAGTGINITSGSGSITIASVATDTWTNVTTTTQTMVAGGAYTASNAGLVTLTLPTTAAYGTIMEVATGTTSGGWKIAQNASQSIQFGSVATTTGTGGSLQFTALGDSVKLLCTVANTTFQVLSAVGNITYV